MKASEGGLGVLGVKPIGQGIPRHLVSDAETPSVVGSDGNAFMR
jgi:hypothetical protein